jgi:hypothetical protein
MPTDKLGLLDEKQMVAIDWTCDWLMTQLNLERVIDDQVVEEARNAYVDHLAQLDRKEKEEAAEKARLEAEAEKKTEEAPE